jgi:hypothetical protein
VVAWLSVAAGLLVAIVSVGPAGASPPAASIHGAGNVFYPDFPEPGTSTTERVIINASLLPSGQPGGSILLLSPFGFTKADVTCIRVVGDTIYVGGSLVPGFDFYRGETFAQIAFGVRDGMPDVVASAIFRRADLNTCDVLSGFPPIFAVSEGNFVVSAF